MPLVIIPGGGHQATVWRAALTPMFDWMTPQLAKQVEIAEWSAKQHKVDKVHRAVKPHVVTKKPAPLT